MEKVSGMATRVRKAGIATDGSAQSMSARGAIIIAPTRIRAGAVAAAGIAWASGAANRATRNNRPTTTAVRPVRPPAETPDALSI